MRKSRIGAWASPTSPSSPAAWTINCPRARSDATPGVELEAKIKAVEPKLLAFTSLTAGRRYLGRAAGFGEQPERIRRTRVWLLPSPSPAAGWNWDGHKHWWRTLADAAREDQFR